LIICLIASINKQNFNYRYSSAKKGFINKDIIKPFPGKYDEDDLNALSAEESFVPILTNDKGIAQFSESFFSIYGIIGKFSEVFNFFI